MADLTNDRFDRLTTDQFVADLDSLRDNVA